MMMAIHMFRCATINDGVGVSRKVGLGVGIFGISKKGFECNRFGGLDMIRIKEDRW